MKIHPIICLVLIAALLTSPAWASCGTWIIRGNTEYHYDAEYENAVKSSTGHAAALNPSSACLRLAAKLAVKFTAVVVLPTPPF